MKPVTTILADIHQQSFPPARAWSEQSFEELLGQPGVALYQQEGALLMTRSVADEMEVLTIAVLPAFRRQAVATTLMQQAIQEAKEQGIGCCFLEVDRQNVAAVRCYERLGFTVMSVREGYYQGEDGRSDALVMRFAMV